MKGSGEILHVAIAVESDNSCQACCHQVYIEFKISTPVLFWLLQKVKDSWRVVNHRDIIPTVPRLMGYCHVAHPVYLATGNQKDDMVSGSFV